MLPYLVEVEAEPKIINFDQSTHFYLQLSQFTKGGACAGISFDWIRQHSQGKMSTFVCELNSAQRFNYIEYFQIRYNYYGRYPAIKAFIDDLNLKQGIVIHYPVPVNYGVMSNFISGLSGYLWIALTKVMNNIRVGHAVAMFNNNSTYEFFDPNYGSAFFPTRNDFTKWYEIFCWSDSITSIPYHYNIYQKWTIFQFLNEPKNP